MLGRASPVWSKRSLFTKYFVVLFAAVTVPLVVAGVGDAVFSYREQRRLLNDLMRVEGVGAADKISGFLSNIVEDMGLAVQRPWSNHTEESGEEHRLDALRVLRQVPAIVDLTLLDGESRERLHVSRITLNRRETQADRSGDRAVIALRSARVWYGPVTYRHGSEPYMSIAVAGNRRIVGAAIADVNLKFISEVISAIRVGRSGSSFVLDQNGRLIAHPDMTKVLSGAETTARSLERLRAELVEADEGASAVVGPDGEEIVATLATITGANWSVVVQQPRTEAFASIYASLWRTTALLIGGALLAGFLAFSLARRMTSPIRLLEEGTQRIGAGNFEHRVIIRTGDELERLADRFNQMAGDLALAQDRSERIARLKRFLAPQIAELVENNRDDNVLAGQRANIVVIFCDLRGFTAVSSHAEPEQLMKVLSDYYRALGAVINRFGATVTSFSGDGLMAILNAPVACEDPAKRAVEMATAMQEAVQNLIVGWRPQGHELGFGVGLAMGWATVGQIGYESRLEYTAVGSVVNLAARLCATAIDRQVLLDSVAASALQRSNIPLEALGNRRIKGYDRPIQVYNVSAPTGRSTGSETPRHPESITASPHPI